MTQKKKATKKIEKVTKKLIKKIAVERFSAKSFKKDLCLTNLNNKKDLADIVYLAEKTRAEKIKQSNKLAKLVAIREIVVDRDINAGD